MPVIDGTQPSYRIGGNSWKHGCGLRTGTANGAVASVSVSWGIQGLLWGGLGRHPGHAEASFAVK